MRLRIGTRKSRLAMVQAELVRDAIVAEIPSAEVELVPMATKGDRHLERSLASFGGKGVFTGELEEALLDGRIDLAVHSAKDMPMEFPEGLALGAVFDREDPRDVLVTVSGIPGRDLPPGSVIGTGSLRRELQMKEVNPQVRIKLLRGNVPTRIEKLKNGGYDGILLAAAGLKRLGLAPACSGESPDMAGIHMEYLDPGHFIPAPGQGILAVEIRKGELGDVMAAVHSTAAAVALAAEREFMRQLDCGCNAPCGAYCRRSGGTLQMDVMYARDGIHPAYWSGCLDAGYGAGGDVVCGPGAGGSGYDAAVALAGQLVQKARTRYVSLVGAGPGDAGLLTEKGLDCVRRADVIVYDNLISGSVLNQARLDAELIYAGKRAGAHHLPQEQINRILVEKARAGKYTVRLKGGDPYVFGRGGEEALALSEHQIPFEVVPGVTSASSVPACAGIPVTHRGLASSFHVVTGHEGVDKATDKAAGKAMGKGKAGPDYEALAGEEGTIVFLMGLGNLEEIARQLMLHGKSGDTPAAVIEQGTTARQRKVVSTLKKIAAAAAGEGIRTPAVTVVGDVVSLERRLSWLPSAPLAGIRVLATGTRRMAGELKEALDPLGAETVAVSLIEARPVMSEECVQVFCGSCGSSGFPGYTWLVFTSANGVDIFFRELRRRDVDLRCLMHLKFAAVGEKTAEELKRNGFLCDFVPSSYTGECLAREWIPTLEAGSRVLLMRAKEGNPVLPQKLREAGIAFDDVALYETWVDGRRREELNRVAQGADYIVLASPSAAAAWVEMAADPQAVEAKLVSIGPTTTKAAGAAGLTVSVEAAEYTAAGIAAAILADRMKAGQRAGERTWEKAGQRAEGNAVEKTEGQREAACGQAASYSASAQAVRDPLYFPLFIDLNGRPVLLAGAGTVASRRAAVLAEFGAAVTVVAPEGSEPMGQLAREGILRWERRAFVPEDIRGMDLVIAATDDSGLNGTIVELCRREGIPVNNAGNRDQCDFYFPGIAREGGVVVGVTASGRDHGLARRITAQIQDWLKSSLTTI